MAIDLLQSGFILLFLALLGYTIGYFYDLGYRGQTYKPKGGDFDRFLHYSSNGLILIVLISILGLLLYGTIIPLLVSVLFPDVTPQLLFTSVATYLLLLALIEVIMAIAWIFGRSLRYLKNKYKPTEIIIETNDKEKPEITVSEIYDENTDFFFFLYKNGNWGLIKKSLVNRIHPKDDS